MSIECAECKGEGQIVEYDLARFVKVITVCYCQEKDDEKKEAIEKKEKDIAMLYGP